MAGRLAHAHPGWLARASAGLGVVLAVAGLGMLGRAVAWGRVRTVFWWRRPLWVAEAGVTEAGVTEAGAASAVVNRGSTGAW